MLAHRREEEVSTRFQDPIALSAPGLLQLFVQMRHHREGVDEIEGRVGIREGRGQLVDGNFREGKVARTPLDHFGVDVATGYSYAGRQLPPVTEDSSASAPPVEQPFEFLHRRTVLSHEGADDLGLLE